MAMVSRRNRDRMALPGNYSTREEPRIAEKVWRRGSLTKNAVNFDDGNFCDTLLVRVSLVQSHGSKVIYSHLKAELKRGTSSGDNKEGRVKSGELDWYFSI
ncbi:hypothetical protein CDAR_55541 [Caerostris darwini]|uniref:Uncharacterized protein n=1 Tax=Caerostris darwini TaxID=1538125 RepID=A0AAV4W3X4_9ARAC|nr:hypothetical protein CDAR_55541 [Caerostris darwini]